MASGLGNPPYDSSVAYLSGSFPEKGYDEVCLSFADLPFFLLLGIFKGLWHPGWLVFLAIPVYYAVADYFRRLKKERTKEDNQGENYKEEDSSL